MSEISDVPPGEQARTSTRPAWGTCGGDFDDGTGHYEDNIVVYAVLRMAHAA